MDEEKDDERKQTKTATKIKQSMHNNVTLDEPETCNYDQNNCKCLTEDQRDYSWVHL